MIRLLDWLLSFFLLLVFLPVFIIISLCIAFNSAGPVLYKQKRIGRFGREFSMWKFRTMYTNSGNGLQLTVGSNDKRITSVGHYLRKFKLDELPQLVNVLSGEMSLVGPRPEVKKYVDLYTEEQKQVLSVRPGITDYASIAFANESELLTAHTNPEQYYVEEIMPEKIRLNRVFIDRPSVGNYLRVLFLTVKKIVAK